MNDTRVTKFARLLEDRSADYILDQRMSDEHCLIQFIGAFDGHPVVWHARIQTLKNYASGLGNTRTPCDSVKLQQFIEITQEHDTYKVHVGLNLPQIDERTILRTIIMIRKYKRLRMGRHEFGELVEFQL